VPSHTELPQIDFTAIKARQQATWASGDYASVAARIPIVAELLCDAADLRAGDRVLDVATGTGNAAIAAARCGAKVLGIDYVATLLERARIRSMAEGLVAEFRQGDAESLPLEDGAFDAVISVFGVMFTPDQEQAAREMVRVCRPGGTIALACWTPDGFVGEMFQVISRHVAAPAGVRSPMDWGREDRLKELLGEGVSALVVQPRSYTFRFRSAQEFVHFFREYYGPTLRAFAALDPSAQADLTRDLVEMVRRFDRRGVSGGPIAVPATYLEIVAIRE
jgi:ubiquinone/menaquinone biosynthesis C-methylase UbiE